MAKSTAAPTTTKAAPAAACATKSPCVPQEKIAMLAYQKWMMGGCQHGNDQQHWLDAEKELMAELAKSGTMPKK